MKPLETPIGYYTKAPGSPVLKPGKPPEINLEERIRCTVKLLKMFSSHDTFSRDLVIAIMEDLLNEKIVMEYGPEKEKDR